MSTFEWSPGTVGSLVVEGVRLETQCFGPPPDEAPTFVLLHEGLGCIELWRDFPEELTRATGHGVFVYSRQGYGQSDSATLPRPLDVMSLEASCTLPKILDAIHLQHGILLGHSDGASIAALYAGGAVADYRVRGLVLMAPHFFTEEIAIAEISKTKKEFEKGDLENRMSNYHKHVESAFRGWCDVWLDPEFIDWDITDSIDYLRMPVLVIQGRQDQYGTLAQVEVVQQRCYAPVDAVILDDCRHSPHLDQPQATLSAITEYAQRLAEIENSMVSIPAIAAVS